MIKRNLLALILLISSYGAYSQCTPNTYTGNHGFILPDSAAFPHALISQPFTATIKLQVAQDTVGTFQVPNLGPTAGTFAFDSVTIYSVTTNPALPAGVTMQYTCNPTNCKFLGANTGCIDLTVSPISTPGIYRIYVNTVAKGTFTPAAFPIPLTNQSTNSVVDWYKIIVDTTGTYITDYAGDLKSMSLISVQQNNDNTSGIKFYTPNNKLVVLKVNDINGREVYSEQLKPNTGVNYLNIENLKFSSGFYFVSLVSGNTIDTKKLLIQH